MIERKSDRSHTAPGETSVKRRHTPAQMPVADIPHPCLLSLKTDRKQRKRGGGLFDCWQAPEAATQCCLENKNKLKHKVLSALRAAVFFEKNKKNFSFKKNKTALVLSSDLRLCATRWSDWGIMSHAVGVFHSIVYFNANYMPINDELSLFSLQ